MSKFLKILQILIFLGGVSFGAQARDIIELSVDATSEKTSRSQARQDLFDDAIEQVSLKYIKEIIGEAKANKNIENIKNKIIKQSGKYVLFIKGGEFNKSAKGSEMVVSMKLSLKSLQKLLLQQGLLYKIEGPPKVLPMISIQDRVNGNSYAWWADEDEKTNSFLKRQLFAFHEALRAELKLRGFYSLNPGRKGFSKGIPVSFQSENPPMSDVLFVGEYFSSQIVVRGKVVAKKSHQRPDSFALEFKLSAVHTNNGRIIGEVIRTYETEPGSFQPSVGQKLKEVMPLVSKDLTVQLHDAWKSGTFGASLLKLSVRGKLNYRDLKKLKDILTSNLSEIKALKERKFLPGEVVFEVDAGTTAENLAASFKKVPFSPFKLQVLEASAGEIEVRIKK